LGLPLYQVFSRFEDRDNEKANAQRHRLVYDALQDFIDQGLHALAIELI
jgi:stress-induced morphogen